MFRLVFVASILVPVTAAADQEQVEWHVDVSVSETRDVVVKQDTQSAVGKSSVNEHHHEEGKLQFTSDDLGSPAEPLDGGITQYRLQPHKPNATIGGSYAASDDNKSSSTLTNGLSSHSERTVGETAKMDRISYSFEYSGDKDWHFGASSTLVGTTVSHQCDTDAMYKETKCYDGNDKMGGRSGPAAAFAAGDAGAKLSRTATGFVLDYSHDERNDDPDKGRTETHHVEAHVTLTRKLAPSKYEAVFIPGKDWATFIPEGPKFPATSGDGNSVSFSVELRDRKTHKKSTKRFSTHYVLDSSKLRGTCNNWPGTDEKASDAPDFAFVTKPVAADDQSLTLSMGSGGAKVRVTSRDFGGYARVVAHIHTEDGVDLDAVWTDGTAALSIPKDDNLDHIADEWEKNVPSKSALADDEDPGDGFGSPGDGYTLFAEYRGFVEADETIVVHGNSPVRKRRYTRFNPLMRDLFLGLAILNKSDEPAVIASTSKFVAITKFAAHYVGALSTTGSLPNDEPLFPRGAILGRDGHEDLFGKAPAYVIWVSDEAPHKGNESPAFTRSIHQPAPMKEHDPDSASLQFYSPADVTVVSVSRKNSETMAKNNADVIDPAVPYENRKNPGEMLKGPQFHHLLDTHTAEELHTTAEWARAHSAELGEKVMKFLLMHELGHAIGAYHHGEDAGTGSQTCPMWYWHFKDKSLYAFLHGDWDPSDSTISHKPYAYCDENRPQIHLHPKD